MQFAKKLVTAFFYVCITIMIVGIISIAIINRDAETTVGALLCLALTFGIVVGYRKVDAFLSQRNL